MTPRGRVRLAESIESLAHKSLTRVSVVGLGKLGAPLATCFALRGFPTIAVDLDDQRVQAINNLQAPVYELGLQEALEKSEGRLTATSNYDAAIVGSDVSFVVVPTPSEESGGFSLRDVTRSLTHIGRAIRKKVDFHLVVLTSTVMPGASRQKLIPLLEAETGKTCGQDFGFCYSPEFVALGSVVGNLLRPDFILIGESDPVSGEMLMRVYRQLCENSPPVARMNCLNAELTKLAVNTYVTTKITFANLLARICERLPGGDIDVVTSALGLDSRIGGAYLKGAIGYGGPCFPRDNIALAALARSVDVSSTLPEATDRFNRQQVHWLADLIQRQMPIRGSAGILGLAYKPGTDVIDDSQGVQLAQTLLNRGIPVIAYDPMAALNARRVLSQTGMTFADSARECIQNADVVVVVTPWSEFTEISAVDCAHRNRPLTVIDCWRILPHLRGSNQIVYVPLGVGALGL